jgi:hypothetical protein
MMRWVGLACAALVPVIMFVLKVIVVVAVWRVAKAIRSIAETYKRSKGGASAPAKGQG